MTYQELKDFITTKMRMSHIYQPVMLIEILKKGGYASAKQIAKAILNHDPTKIKKIIYCSLLGFAQFLR